MGFKQLAELDASVTTAIGGVDKETGKKNPTSVEGYYIGTRKVESRKAKSGWCSLHILQTANGNLGVWGKTNLDQKMPSVTPGQMIRITFLGMVETRNNPMYKYKVEVDADNTIEVNLPGEDTAQPEQLGNNGEELSGADYAEESNLDDEPAADEPPLARPTAPARKAAAPDAKRAAAVQSLLGGRK